MKGNNSQRFFCPICGSEIGDVSPYAVKITCQHCGKIVSVPSVDRDRVYRCANHSERIAVGKCDVCGKSFCEECLSSGKIDSDRPRGSHHQYFLRRTPKFVCLSCLSAKYDRRGNVCVYLGIVLLVGGILSLQILPGYSMAIVMAGFSLAIYGGLQRLASEKSFKNQNHGEEEKQKAEPNPVDQLYVDELYSSLLQYYSTHWGPSLGHKLLRSEIFAYLSHGISYQEAVKKIYKRQAEKLGM